MSNQDYRIEQRSRRICRIENVRHGVKHYLDACKDYMYCPVWSFVQSGLKPIDHSRAPVVLPGGV